jgi:hypothetical protein
MLRLEQVVIEDKFSKRNVREKIMKEIIQMDNNTFGDKIDTACQLIQNYMSQKYFPSKDMRIAHLRELDLSIDDIVYEILLIILPVASVPNGYLTIQSVAGRLAHVLKYPDIFDGVKTAAELVTIVCNSDLYDVIKPSASVTGSALVTCKYALSPEVVQYISDVKYLPPLICKPNEIRNNWDCGYLTAGAHEPIMLKGNTHRGKMPLDVINIRNNIQLSLEPRMLEIEEAPSKELDTPEKISNFMIMKESSKQVYQDLLIAGNGFYLTHRVDQRLRMYCQGYHCSYQSSKYKRSIIELTKKEILT